MMVETKVILQMLLYRMKGSVVNICKGFFVLTVSDHFYHWITDVP